MSKRKLPEVSKRIFPYDLVIAWWEDIVADSIWVSIPDIKKSTTAICCTVGWLMKQDDKVTILMSDFNFESNNEIKQGGGHTTIPTKNILKIKKIKLNKLQLSLGSRQAPLKIQPENAKRDNLHAYVHVPTTFPY